VFVVTGITAVRAQFLGVSCAVAGIDCEQVPVEKQGASLSGIR